jgi:hypothetical protein
MFRPISNRGLGLIELLIAVLLGMIVLGLTFEFFSGLEGISQSVGVMTTSSQSLQSSVDLISRDLYEAGQAIPQGGIPLPSGPGSVSVIRPGAGANYFPSNNGVLSAITPGADLSGTIDGEPSDEITVIMTDVNWLGIPVLGVSSVTYAGGSGYSVVVTIPASCEPGVTVPSSFNCTLGPDGYNVNAGDLMMFTTVGGLNALGMITQVNYGTNTITFGSDSLHLNQACAAEGCAGSIDSLQQAGAYPSGMSLTLVDMVTYYLVASDNSNPPHQYVLMRQLDDATAYAVAYGINSLQFSYDFSDGTDTDIRDPNPTEYPGQGSNQVRTVLVDLSTISSEPMSYQGQYYSNSVATSVTIRNLEYVNQFP